MQQQQQESLTKLPERYDPYWKALNDKQVEEARLRQQEEQVSNQRLRSNYREELVKLIEEKQRQKHDQQLHQKLQDHQMVERSIELQKVLFRQMQRTLQIEQLRQKELNEINLKLDRENETYENFKRQREQQMRQIENQMHENALKQTEEELRREREFEEYRKVQLRKQMNESLEVKDLIRRRQKMTEAEYDRQMIAEQQKIVASIDSERNRYLYELKVKAGQVDPYGVNGVYKNIHNRSVQQQRKEEIETLRDAVDIEQQHKQGLQEQRIRRLFMQNRYRHELKDQMYNKQTSSKLDRQYQTQSDRNMILLKVGMQQRQMEEAKRQQSVKKQDYLQFLKKQAEEVKEIRQQDFKISPLEYQLNRPLLDQQKTQSDKAGNIIPGSYRSIDYERKRQLSILEKSVNHGGETARSRDNRTISYDGDGGSPRDGYFQRNGRRLLQ